MAKPNVFSGNLYGTAFQTDLQRHAVYTKTMDLFKIFDSEFDDLENENRYSDTDADLGGMEWLIRGVDNKRQALSMNYAEQYSLFQIQEIVQLVYNNRVMGMGEVREIMLGESEQHLHEMLANRLAAGFTADGREIIYYTEYEFLYIIQCYPYPENGKFWLDKKDISIVVKPRVMYNSCPLCDVSRKPLVNSVIGNTQRVICVDCDNLLRDIFGNRFVTETLKYEDIPQLPEFPKIYQLSASK